MIGIVLSVVLRAPVAMAAALLVFHAAQTVETPQGEKKASQKQWRAPKRARRKKNPIPATRESIARGKKVYDRECLSCHGATGVGDGPGAKDLEVSPGDLSAPTMVDQSDGALYWKVRIGRTPMPSFATLLSKEERWLVINYVRTLAHGTRVVEPDCAAPQSFRTAISALVGAYTDVRRALAGTKPAEAARTVPVLAKSIQAIDALDPKQLDKEWREAWSAGARRLEAAAASLEAAGEPGAMRAAFAALSTELVRTLEEFGHAHGSALRVFRCSKAPGGAGAVWLQVGDEPACPYGGAAAHEHARASRMLAGKRSKQTKKVTK